MSFLQLRSQFYRNTGRLPQVTTQAATGVGTTSATANGTLVNAGPAPVTVKGFVWATHPSPTLADNVVNDAGTALGSYSDSLTGLPTTTQIYFAAYATNMYGTAYGADQTFTTGGGVTAYSDTLMMMGV